MNEGRKRIAIISTGGTIEKTYDALRGILENRVSVLDVMLDTLVLRGVEIARVRLMNKDSLDLTEADHARIVEEVARQESAHDGIVITHGTDRLAVTGHRIVDFFAPGVPRVPVVLIGAMQPYELRTTDAVQNLTEALMAVQLLSPGVYVVMHNQALRFPGIEKDRERGTFVKTSGASRQ
jgi:L-asparaginase